MSLDLIHIQTKHALLDILLIVAGTTTYTFNDILRTINPLLADTALIVTIFVGTLRIKAWFNDRKKK